MPPGGASTHGDMVATIRKVAHEKFTSDASAAPSTKPDGTGRGGGESDDGDSWRSRRMNTTRRSASRRLRRGAGAGRVGRTARLGGGARSIRLRAFEPYLEKLVELKRRYVGFFPPATHPYDVLLDDFEPA
jgi:carboxypeptidase Taq